MTVSESELMTKLTDVLATRLTSRISAASWSSLLLSASYFTICNSLSIALLRIRYLITSLPPSSSLVLLLDFLLLHLSIQTSSVRLQCFLPPSCHAIIVREPCIEGAHSTLWLSLFDLSLILRRNHHIWHLWHWLPLKAVTATAFTWKSCMLMTLEHVKVRRENSANLSFPWFSRVSRAFIIVPIIGQCLFERYGHRLCLSISCTQWIWPFLNWPLTAHIQTGSKWLPTSPSSTLGAIHLLSQYLCVPVSPQTLRWYRWILINRRCQNAFTLSIEWGIKRIAFGFSVLE